MAAMRVDAPPHGARRCAAASRTRLLLTIVGQADLPFVHFPYVQFKPPGVSERIGAVLRAQTAWPARAADKRSRRWR